MIPERIMSDKKSCLFSLIRWSVLVLFLLVADRISYSSYRGGNIMAGSFSFSVVDHPTVLSSNALPDSSVSSGFLQYLSERSNNANKKPTSVFAHFPEYRMVSIYGGDSMHQMLLPAFLAKKYQQENGYDAYNRDELSIVLPGKKPPEKTPQRNVTATNHQGALKIMGEGILNNEELRDFVLAHNDSIDTAYVEKLVKIYIEEATREGVNHDVAFVQMCHETDFLKYTGVVHPDQKNFCGLGTVNDDTPGEYFETVEKGIRAHIQHLKAYASKQELKHELVDNRFYFVQRGIAPVVEELTGRWATDPDYDRKIKKLFKRLEANTERQLIRLSI